MKWSLKERPIFFLNWKNLGGKTNKRIDYWRLKGNWITSSSIFSNIYRHLSRQITSTQPNLRQIKESSHLKQEQPTYICLFTSWDDSLNIIKDRLSCELKVNSFVSEIFLEERIVPAFLYWPMQDDSKTDPWCISQKVVYDPIRSECRSKLENFKSAFRVWLDSCFSPKYLEKRDHNKVHP